MNDEPEAADPEETWRQLRELAAQVRAGDVADPLAALDEAAELIESLGGWMGAGAFLPSAPAPLDDEPADDEEPAGEPAEEVSP